MSKMYREYKLDNGLVVALQNTPTKTIAAKLRVNYGPFHEKEGEEGLAHFLEHCIVTGGSEKYNPAIADEIRESFADYDAITSLGRIILIGQMLPEDLELWLDYTSDHVFKPRFDEARVNGERQRVLREISDKKSNPMYLVNAEFDSIFHRDHPKSRFNLGKEEVVRNADLNQLRSFHSRGYHPNNIDLIIAGNLPDNVEAIVNKYFERFQSGEKTRTEFPKLKPLQEKTIIHRYAQEMYNADNPEESSALIYLAFLAPERAHEDMYPAIVICNLLGKGTNSRLYQNMGLKKGLAYSTNCFYNGDYNAGAMQLTASVPSKKIDESVSTIFEELDKIRTENVDNKFIEQIRKWVKYDLAKKFESNGGYVSSIEDKLDYGLTPEYLIEAYNKITPERVMETANKYLPDRENGEYVLYIRDPLKRE